MAHFAKLFGEKLIDNKGKEYDTASELEGKYVLIYFSAHWCPPCRQFTPMLAKTYQNLKNKNINFEIVFNSWDKSPEQFKGYLAEMPWKAIPNFEYKKTLDKQFKVSGIPSLVVLDKDGNTVTTKGRNAVMKDPNGNEFPWAPKKLSELVPSLNNIEKEEISLETLQGKHFGILFGGKWIGQKFISFIQQLNTIRTKLKENGQEFPLIYATLDKTAKDYREILELLPNDTLVFELKDPVLEELADDLGVTTLPNFTIMDTDGSILNTNGFAALNLDKTGEFFPWGPRAVESLELASNNDLNSSVCAIAIIADQNSQFAKFKSVAEDHFESFKKGEKEEVKFFVSDGTDAPSKRLQSVFKVNSLPSIIFMSLPKFLVTSDFDNFETILASVATGTNEQMSSL